MWFVDGMYNPDTDMKHYIFKYTPNVWKIKHLVIMKLLEAEFLNISIKLNMVGIICLLRSTVHQRRDYIIEISDPGSDPTPVLPDPSDSETVVLDGTMKIENWEFSNDLKDPNSILYKEYSDILCDEVRSQSDTLCIIRYR